MFLNCFYKKGPVVLLTRRISVEVNIFYIFTHIFSFHLFQLCFAYKGFVASKIGVRYSYRSADDSEIYTENYEFYHAYQTDSSTV